MLESLNYSVNTDSEQVALVGHALSSPIRLTVLKLLTYKNLAIKDIANEIGIPINTLLNHIAILEKAGLIGTQTTYTTKGKSKSCYRMTDCVCVTLFDQDNDLSPRREFEEYELPVGSFFDFYDVAAPSGMASSQKRLGSDNDVQQFLSPERSKASIIWFTHGFLEYRVPLPSATQLQRLTSIEVTFEACSEAPLYNNDFKSDISIFINDKQVGIYTSPGDYGDRRGLLNPDYWPTGLTQYGTFLSCKVDANQTTINNSFVSYESIHSLKLDEIKQNYLTLKIGVDPKAKHAGGINLFGKHFGDYSQDIIFKYIY